ncbi:MurR/RpiR family transcriptional regulator [Faecalicatena orotica]|uniref:MurR/RpiR family transcriptional regulator n=1 Tax=Faecalicatena orotica TaxID=1544 RepID=UPI0032172337
MEGISCKQKIRGKMNHLTNTETKIGKYVLDNYDSVLTSNITELAEKAGVSDASVVRFCKSLGYKGYQDFKINAARDILPKEKHLNPSLEPSDDMGTICKKIFSTEVAVLDRTLAGLDLDAVERAAHMIRNAEKIVVFGSGGSLLVGKDAQHKFLKIGIQVYVYEDVDMQLMASSLMKEGEVALCISHSGCNSNVVNCMKNAAENGAGRIALVSQGKTPVSKNADVVLYTASEETIFKSESVSTRIAQLAIMDSLVAIAAFQDYEDSYQAIQQTRKATSQNKY